MSNIAYLTTRTAVVDYLETIQNKPRNFAQAMTNEFLNYDSDEEAAQNRDFIRFGPPPEPNSEPTNISTEHAISLYEDFMDYGIVLTPEGILFDGELIFDRDGNYLPIDQQQPQ
jgi:hypothetical protein